MPSSPSPRPARRPLFHVLLAVAVVLPLATPVSARDPAAEPAPALAIPGLVAPMQSAEYWIARLPASDAVRLDADGVASLAARMQRDDPAFHAPLALPGTVPRDRVAAWIAPPATRPSTPRYDADGRIDDATLDRWQDALALDALPARVTPRFGLVVRRTDVRTFPTTTRVFNRPDDTDIDRFQEDALFPGTPVAAVHTSRDGDWMFVVSARYRGWVAAGDVALGPRDVVADYVRRAEDGPIVTGATAHTAYTPEQPAVSRVRLEMGVRLPRAAWPATRTLHGQVPAFGRVVELPIRGDDGRLAFAPALLPAAEDLADAPLPYTSAHVLRQAFKFLGERYGWGHAYGARDCSGFVSEIYRSLGIPLPRNTGAQATSPVLDRLEIAPELSFAARLRALRDSDVGDLVFIPGHVMLIIGHVDGEPWVIHDTAGVHLADAAGTPVRLPLNGVVVTPLTPLLGEDGGRTIDRITSIQRVR